MENGVAYKKKCVYYSINNGIHDTVILLYCSIYNSINNLSYYFNSNDVYFIPRILAESVVEDHMGAWPYG